MKGALSAAGTVPRMAALLEVDEPLLVVPLPLAVPPSLVEASLVAHCEPSPLRPGPLPAPSVKNC
jgi:hypothetical protein